MKNKEFISLDEIQCIQGKLLIEQIQRIFKSNSVLKNVLISNNVNVDTVKELSDICKLPLTSKKELHAWGWDALTVSKSAIAEIVSTSGTTGKLFYFPLTEKDLESLAQGECNAFNSMGINKNDKFQITITLDHLFMAGLAYYLGARKIGATVYRVGPGKMECQVDTGRILGTTAMVGVPSFIHKLLSSGKFPELRKIVLVGEAILNREFKLNELGQSIQNLTNAELFSSHGITEIGCSFSECSAHSGLHSSYEHIIAEVLDNEGNPVKSGEVGELVVTTLLMEAMPVIRYRTGDLVARLPDVQCDCGRNSMRIGPVIGRKDHAIKLKGTTIYPGQIQQVLCQYLQKEVINYQIIVSTSHEGLDKISLIVGTSGNRDKLIDELRSSFRSTIRVVPEIQMISPEEVDRALYLNGSRKARIFNDCRMSIGSNNV